MQAQAQEGTSKLIRQGNAQYKKQQYADAEASYKKALERNNKSVEGNYNLGNSLYEQKRFDAARQQYSNTIKSATGKEVKADASYNIGNSFMEDKKWEESIKNYKTSLKANPHDEQARYNLAYAQAMLKKQQQQGGGKDDKENKDKQKDQKDKKDQEKKEQEKKDQKQNQDEQKEQDKDQQQQPQPKPSKLTPEEAKRLLQNLAQQEKKLQEDKMKKVKGTPGSVEKDW
ncbi:tetratricopeptide repeat protein [Chitinophaga barathri]|uniref:Tetratricopeptide repeat protein n=2 Tax=Chitinophaga barathri TaxID=1647451 RepID=A0A3N4M9E3_9BACT|nr:tetratricopeptide repeat protein [Chitinophaga barathri]